MHMVPFRLSSSLAQAFGCSVNELPLSYVLSWYEQKAVCILLTLLHLGIQNISAWSIAAGVSLSKRAAYW